MKTLPKCLRRGAARSLLAVNLFLIVYVMFILNDYANDKDVSRNSAPTTVEKYHSLVKETMLFFDYMEKMKMGHFDKSEKLISHEHVNTIWCPWWAYPQKPDKSKIAASNALWRRISSENEQIFVYSAYYDTRFDQRTPEASGFIRILGVAWRTLRIQLYCYLWWKISDKLIIVSASTKLIWLKDWDPRDSFYNTYLFSCPVPRFIIDAVGTPDFVSLTVHQCTKNTATFLPINNGMTKVQRAKKHTVVCVKGLDFLNDLSLQLVEWLEANYALGADKIVIYTYDVHPKMAKVLDYYSNERWNKTEHRFESLPLTLPGQMPDENIYSRSAFIKRNRQQKRRSELLPYNDCVYRHVHTHEYALIIDLDELVVPGNPFSNWSQLLMATQSKLAINSSDSTAFSLTNAFYIDNFTEKHDDHEKSLAKKFRFTFHDVRSSVLSPKGWSGKSFMRIENILTVFNHYPLHLLRLSQKLQPTVYIPPNMALKNHYKTECPLYTKTECDKLFSHLTKDASLNRFRSIVQNVKRVLNKLQI